MQTERGKWSMSPELVAAPDVAPLALSDVKRHLRIDTDADDARLSDLIDVAAERLDGWQGILGRCLISQTWAATFPCFWMCGLRLPLLPVASVTSVTYFSPDGAKTTMVAEAFRLVYDASGARVMPAHGTNWPLFASRDDAVRVEFIVGYGADAASVPAPIRHAMLMMISHWYTNTEAVAQGNEAKEIPLGAKSLLAPYRIVRF